MSAETTDVPVKRSKMKGLFKVLGLVLGAAVLAGGGFAAAYVMFAKPFSPAEDVLSLIDTAREEAEAEADPEAAAEADPTVPQKVPKPVPEQEAFVTSYHTFAEPLTTNLKDSRRFAQVTVGLSTQYDAKVIANVTTHEVALRSDMLAILSTFTEEDIGGQEGRTRLATALKDAVNKRLEELEGFGGIENVFFPSFVLQ